jgi:putative hydrolase of the HAD superfamily
MIKAIIFDCFGVLTTEGWQEFKQTYFSEDAEKLSEANKLNYMADQGKMNHDQLMPMIAELAGVNVEQAIAEIDIYQPNKKLLKFIETDLKPKYKIGMLSNVSDDWLVKMFTHEEQKLFDEIALSFNIGFTKPATQAYQYIIDKLGVEMSEAVFIDDRIHFVDAARDLGMRGVQYLDFAQFKEELENILKMSDSDK